MSQFAANQSIHASCVAVETENGLCGALIRGPSGAGKSALALNMITLGAKLVGDDRLILERRADALFARPHPAIAGLIEARGTGILKAPGLDEARLHVIFELVNAGGERLPASHDDKVLGVSLPLMLIWASGPAAAATAMLAAQYGRVE